MGHHIKENGEFQSDKHPDLPPDRIRLSFLRPASHGALWQLAEDYQEIDSDLSFDIRIRLLSLGFKPPHSHDPPTWNALLRSLATTLETRSEDSSGDWARQLRVVADEIGDQPMDV